MSCITLHSGEEDFHLAGDDLQEGDRLLVWCGLCGRSFRWDLNREGSTPPATCGRACREKNKRRIKAGIYLPCPTPEKARHRHPEEAEEALKRTKELRTHDVRVYLCQCGVYHLGGTNWVVLEREETE